MSERRAGSRNEEIDALRRDVTEQLASWERQLAAWPQAVAERVVDGPRRSDARVGHHEPQLGVAMGHRPIPQPVDERITVRGVEHVVKRVLGPQRPNSTGARHEVQVVVAEHGAGPVAEIGDEPQHVERARAPVDEVPHEPEAVAPGIEAALAKQRPQLAVAALDVADRVRGHLGVSLVWDGRLDRARFAAARRRRIRRCRRSGTVTSPRHQCTTFGTDRLNAGIGASKRCPSSATIW